MSIGHASIKMAQRCPIEHSNWTHIRQNSTSMSNRTLQSDTLSSKSYYDVQWKYL